jgi:hypothetical protein
MGDIAFVFALIGAILVIINGLLIASAGEPIVLTSYPVSSVEDLNATNAGFWGRIALGLPGYVEGWFMIIWLVLAIINLICIIRIYLKQEQNVALASLVFLLFLLSIPIGGGFIVGAVIGIVGSIALMEWPKPFTDTFAGKIIRAAKLDSKFYNLIGENPKELRTAVLTLILVNILSGLGNGLYTLNVDKIRTSISATTSFRILLLGYTYWDFSVIGTSLLFVGIAIVKWLIFSMIVYFAGAKLLGISAEFDQIARVLAFAYVPVCLQVFMPLVLLRPPLLYFEWPFAVVFLTNLWMFTALVVALKETLEVPTSKALGIAILNGAIYWLVNYTFLTPALNVPGIKFMFSPPEIALVLASASVLIAALLGTFT